MELILLEPRFSVCKVAEAGAIDLSTPFVFAAKTDEEVSLVCETSRVPPDALAAEHGWRALKIAGILDFGLVGIIAGITASMAEAGIGVFVISTYNTDYILLKEENVARGIELLRHKGYNTR